MATNRATSKPVPTPPPDASALPPVDPDQAAIDDVDQADERPEPAKTTPAESRAERAARLRAELAELERNDAGVKKAEPTHVLQLANGDLVETANPGATHHAVEEGGPSYPVVNRFELTREEV